MITKFIIHTLFLLFIFSVSFAQSKSDIAKQIEKTKKEIELANKLLKETEKNKKESYNVLLLLNKKISLRKSYIASLYREVASLESDIVVKQKKIKELQHEVKQLKSEYANMIYYAYINKSSYERMMFILSSDDFNQAYRRIKYFQQYASYREEQVKNIVAKQDTLKIAMSVIDSSISVKKSMITEAKREAQALDSEKNQKSDLVKGLEYKSLELKNKLKEKQVLANKLQKEIEKIIAEEQRKKAEQEKYAKKPSDKLLSSKFSDNKGKLPWPANEGVIVEKFGEHPHPVLKNIKVMNNGIDISTPQNSKALAIFDGVVSKIIVIPGSNAAILIRHGDYLSVYNNLINVKVKPGQKVYAKQELGTIFTEKDTKNTVLQLQIWKETVKLNPEEWLSN